MLYSYIVKHDTGFAPNPFGGFCTLACCKPMLRRTIGQNWLRGRNFSQDPPWIIGISEKAKGNNVIFFMKVTECLTYSQYFNDSRFEVKKPNGDRATRKEHVGDNCYGDDTGRIRLPSIHTTPQQVEHDLRGKYVLVSDEFVYFGKKAISMPDNLKDIIAGRGYRCNFCDDTLTAFTQFTDMYQRELEKGAILGLPRDFNNARKKCMQEIKHYESHIKP